MNRSIYPFEFKNYQTPSDRLTCPGCGRKHSLVPYIDVATGKDLPGHFGKCNRIDSCGYYQKPTIKDLNRTEKEWEEILNEISNRPEKPNIVVHMPSQLLLDSLPWNDQNTLALYLKKLLPDDKVKALFDDYFIGNHPVWPGAVVLWFVTINGAVRAGQVKQFDLAGHTVKIAGKDGRVRPRTIWIHSLITEPAAWLQPYLDQKLRCDCLFGEHLLLKYPHKPVALFESPKTAILAAAYFPDFVCLAVGALDYFTYDRAKVLKGRRVILYPDLSKEGKTFAKWAEKAERFKTITSFQVSSLLEKIATDDERANGLDMADYLERSPLSEEACAKKNSISDNQPLTQENATNATPIKREDSIESFDVTEYRQWMRTLAPLAKGENIRLSSSEFPVVNLKLFLTGRLNHIQAFANYREQGNRPLFIRQVQELKSILK